MTVIEFVIADDVRNLKKRDKIKAYTARTISTVLIQRCSKGQEEIRGRSPEATVSRGPGRRHAERTD